MKWQLIAILCLCFTSWSYAGLNFYISQQESLRVLGLEAEFAYVRDGNINDVAQQFQVPVPSHIDQLCFVWENVDQNLVKYSILTKGSYMQLTDQFSVNISNQGLVPIKPQIFCVHLPCGPLSANVEVYMKINFTSTTNVTSLNVVMKKDCPADQQKNPDFIVVAQDIPIDESSHSLYIAIGIAFAILLVFMIALSYFFCPKYNACRPPPPRPLIIDRATYYSPVPGTCTEGDGIATLIISNSAPAESSSESSKPFHLQRNNINLGSILLEGTFGSNYNATLSLPGNTHMDVVIKTVKDNAAEAQVELMLEEGTRFQEILHPNIYQLLGIVNGDEAKPMLVYPFVSLGNLKRWLLQCKGSIDGSLPHPLCTQDLVKIALQVLEGVQYLHQQNVVHKDLATRNCVIGDHLHVKLTDMALSRDFFPNDYHCLGDNENRPIKWMAIESINRREFSNASDVWSFGVVLWEITTLAQQPYAEIDPFEVSHVLKDGYRLTQPVNCPDELYAIMAYCWAASVRKRPAAPQLYRELHDFHQQLNEYI